MQHPLRGGYFGDIYSSQGSSGISFMRFLTGPPYLRATDFAVEKRMIAWNEKVLDFLDKIAEAKKTAAAPPKARRVEQTACVNQRQACQSSSREEDFPSAKYMTVYGKYIRLEDQI